MTALRPQRAPRETGSAATDYWPGITDTDDGLLRAHLSATPAEIGTTGHCPFCPWTAGRYLAAVVNFQVFSHRSPFTFPRTVTL